MPATIKGGRGAFNSTIFYNSSHKLFVVPNYIVIIKISRRLIGQSSVQREKWEGEGVQIDQWIGGSECMPIVDEITDENNVMR